MHEIIKKSQFIKQFDIVLSPWQDYVDKFFDKEYE